MHHGRIVKRTGDGILIEFRSVVDAVRCAIEVQGAMVERNAGVSPDKRIEFRVGVHLGDVVEEADGDLMGDGVNIAARLESICELGRVRQRLRQGDRPRPRFSAGGLGLRFISGATALTSPSATSLPPPRSIWQRPNPRLRPIHLVVRETEFCGLSEQRLDRRPAAAGLDGCRFGIRD